MNVWFVRSNGETGHNEPGTDLYIPGEPPVYPERIFDYRNLCLDGGFIRIGWSASGDIRKPGWESQVRNSYPGIDDHTLRYLKQFSIVGKGDIILMPSGTGQYWVHLGIVEPNGDKPLYSYHYDTKTGDWYENAHRLPVRWLRRSSGHWMTEYLPDLGGNWFHAFGRVVKAKREAISFVVNAGASPV
jgi:hypothetical protein